MKTNLDRILSLATLATAVLAVVLVLRRPAPVAQPQAPAAIAAGAQASAHPRQPTEPAGQQDPLAPGGTPAAPSSNRPLPAASPQPKAEAPLNSDGIGALLAQAVGAVGAGGLSPDSDLGSGEPNIKDQQVSYEGDLVHGRFLIEIAGKDVWVTLSGHMGSKDGYATFEPTEFKVGELSVPISLVNPALQRKLAEQRERMKLPE